jgi:DNA polymerase-3 subunit epsilon
LTGLVTGILLLAGAVLLLGLGLSIRSGRRSRAAAVGRTAQRRHDGGAQHGGRPSRASVPVPSIRVTDRPAGPDDRLPFAEPGMRGRLFHYGGDGPGFEVDAPYAVIDVETTGFSPAEGDRIVEIAIARVDARGRIEDEYATVLNPGRDVGPVFVHGISNSEVQDAPRFEDVAGEILARIDGAIVVAHNAVFEERFLTAEFDRAGIAVPVSPAVCSLWLARRTLRSSNHKLTTLAKGAGLPTVDAHAALADVRTVAALMPRMVSLYGEPLRFLTGTRPMPQLPRDVRPKTRAAALRKGTDGWMSSLMSRLPKSATEASEADAQRYLDALADALEDGRILGGEAQVLARLAGSAGLGAAQVATLHGRFLEYLRSAALADSILTTAEIRQLRTTAHGLGLPDYFDDLKPTSPADLAAARAVVPTPREVRLCTHCRRPGHDRSTCRELALIGR